MKSENKSDLKYVRRRLKSLVKPKDDLRRSELSKKVVIKGESWREFEKMRAEVLAELGPQTKMEEIQCENIISATWKLRRARVVERNLLNEENEITLEERTASPWDPKPRQRIRNIDRIRMQSPEVQNIMQYQIELEKSIQKALERIRRLRVERSKHGKSN